MRLALTLILAAPLFFTWSTSYASSPPPKYCATPSDKLSRAFEIIQQNGTVENLKNHILLNKINANDRNEDCETLYHYALYFERTDILPLLDKLGLGPIGGVDIVDQLAWDKNTTFELALRRATIPNLEYVKKLSTVPFSASHEYKFAITNIQITGTYIEYLISAGADISQTVRDAPPLHISIRDTVSGLTYAIKNSKDVTVVAALINAGANPNKVDGFLEMPSLVYVDMSPSKDEKRKAKIAEILINAGADINRKSTDFEPHLVGLRLPHPLYNGMTPLTAAALSGSVERIKRYVTLGARINEKNRDGWTTLQIVKKLKFNITNADEVISVLTSLAAE